ncbi:MAG: hypothetical protein QF638_01125 [Acidimicrobiales bacterium]|nr:hypothetical protein [Acidimicrobiales bacterium]
MSIRHRSAISRPFCCAGTTAKAVVVLVVGVTAAFMAVMVAVTATVLGQSLVPIGLLVGFGTLILAIGVAILAALLAPAMVVAVVAIALLSIPIIIFAAVIAGTTAVGIRRVRGLGTGRSNLYVVL